MNTSKNSIEEMGWVGIDNIMDLLEDNLLKFAEKTDISPMYMRKYIDNELNTIMDKVWAVKIRRANVYMRELSADVRLP